MLQLNLGGLIIASCICNAFKMKLCDFNSMKFLYSSLECLGFGLKTKAS